MRRPDLGSRASRYVAARDGTLLAVHLFLPRHACDPRSLPALWCYDRYHTVRDILLDAMQARDAAQHREWLESLLVSGYAVALVDARGAGASFGYSNGPFGRSEIEDAWDITEWLAAQPWCNGRIGMLGRSYSGAIQYLTAAHRPPHLFAIFAEMAVGDLYEFAHPGGLFREDFARNWQMRVRELDSLGDAIAVDGDRGHTALRAAQLEHRANRDVFDMFLALPYRDSRDWIDGTQPYLDRSPMAHVRKVAAHGVPICHYTGWMDVWVRDAVRWFRNLDGIQALTIGPWPHGGGMGAALAAAQDKWFAPWLKTTDPAAPDERSSIRYACLGSDARATWHEATTWPPAGFTAQKLYLAPGRSGSVRSRNDGRLNCRCSETSRADGLVVDTTTTTGRTSRWCNAYGAEFGYPDMTPHAEQCLTYTTPPLTGAAFLTGHPEVNLWVSASAADFAVFAYLERVHADGRSEYLTEGCLRASHRATEPAPFDNLGLPFHPGNAASLSRPPQTPFELNFDLHPLSVRLAQGERLRVTIAAADRDNARVPMLPAGSEMRVHHGEHHASSVTLPVAGRLGFAPL